MRMMQLQVTDTDKMQKALFRDQTHPGFKPTPDLNTQFWTEEQFGTALLV